MTTIPSGLRDMPCLALQMVVRYSGTKILYTKFIPDVYHCTFSRYRAIIYMHMLNLVSHAMYSLQDCTGHSRLDCTTVHVYSLHCTIFSM